MQTRSLMLLADLPPQRRRIGLGVSVLLHAALIPALVLAPGATSSVTATAPASRQYSVLVLHLNRPRPREAAEARLAPPKRETIPFVAPPDPNVHQTLVQPDIPPTMKLPVEIPLPNLMVWSDLSHVHRNFVAPAAQTAKPLAKPVLSPAAPVFEQRTNTAQVTLLAARTKATLVFAAPPMTSAGPSAVPLIVDAPPADPAGQSGAWIPAILSQSDLTAALQSAIAIPPANQTAAASSHENGRPGGVRESAAESRADNGPNGLSIPDPAIAELPIPGTTRLTLPKQGKFGLLVTGTSVSAPYAESAGALSGRTIYSVYLPVDLPKKWILEYCLPRGDEQSVSTDREPTLDAPWPWLIVRPDDLGTSNQEYLIVHGMLTAEGRFDQLEMVFPRNPQHKEILLASLRQWTFRPAARDGVPATVEVLLIVPAQPQ